MGQYTFALCSHTLPDVSLDTKYKAEAYAENLRGRIQYAKERLLALCIQTEPGKFCGKDENPMAWLRSEYDDCISELDECMPRLTIVEAVLDQWDKFHHPNGGAYFEGRDFDELARVNGEFIPLVDADGSPHKPGREGNGSWYDSEDFAEENLHLCKAHGIVPKEN